MGVYIKGLKLPSAERQGELLILTDDGRCVDMFSGEYEAVELPPHGRLIDADKLRAEFPHPNDWRNPELAYAHLSGIWATIDCAETIIEAEGCEDG